mmetsp:Transcript_9494/g.25757  ORF Transcript_9494/g.25757 Transcript_9494/m.25757 type:complete len:289 (-) Transcript_9494:370-1236(-)
MEVAPVVSDVRAEEAAGVPHTAKHRGGRADRDRVLCRKGHRAVQAGQRLPTWAGQHSPILPVLQQAEADVGVPRAGPLQEGAQGRHVHWDRSEGLQLQPGSGSTLNDSEACRHVAGEVRPLPLLGRQVRGLQEAGRRDVPPRDQHDGLGPDHRHEEGEAAPTAERRAPRDHRERPQHRQKGDGPGRVHQSHRGRLQEHQHPGHLHHVLLGRLAGHRPAALELQDRDQHLHGAVLRGRSHPRGNVRAGLEGQGGRRRAALGAPEALLPGLHVLEQLRAVPSPSQALRHL